MEDVKGSIQAAGEALEEYKEIEKRFTNLENRITKIESK